MTGVVRPENSAASQQEAVQLASGWLLLGIGIVLVIFIVFLKRKIGKKPEFEMVIDSISPRIIRAYYKAEDNLEKALKRKGLSDRKINGFFDYLGSRESRY